MCSVITLRELQDSWNLCLSSELAQSILEQDNGVHAENGADQPSELQTVILNMDLCRLSGLIEKGKYESVCTQGLAKTQEILAQKSPLFTQVQSVVDLTQPRHACKSTESKIRPLYKLKLTTGKLNFNALCLDYCGAIETLAPGTKLLINTPSLLVMDGTVLLPHEHLTILGGIVEALHEPWITGQKSSKLRLSKRNVSGAPKFTSMQVGKDGDVADDAPKSENGKPAPRPDSRSSRSAARPKPKGIYKKKRTTSENQAGATNGTVPAGVGKSRGTKPRASAPRPQKKPQEEKQS